MNNLVRFLVLALLVIAALSSYSYGSSAGLMVFIILGFIFEGLFWKGLFRKKNKEKIK